jgi:hypothetical protein
MMVPVVNEALKRLKAIGIKEHYVIVHDIEEMKRRGISVTPALEIDDELLIHGKYPGVDGMYDILYEKLSKPRKESSTRDMTNESNEDNNDS